MKFLKRIGLALVLLIAILALLIFINPQINPSHTEPYFNLVAEQQGQPPAEEAIRQRVILYGDAGHSSIDPWQPSMRKAAERASISPEKTAIVALGDNIYMKGYPQKEPGQEEWDEDQLKSISYLDAQLKLAQETGAALYLVPGNHDWYATELDSQAQHIADYAEAHGVTTEFHPHHPGKPPLPTGVDLDGVSLVFLDTEWLLHADEPERSAALEQITSLIETTRSQHPQNLIILNAHHPMETMGQHGGYLAEFSYWFFIKLIYTIFPQAMDEDTYSPVYQRMIADLYGVMGQYDGVMFAGGHEHSLQVFGHESPDGKGPEYTLVSGAANTSKLSGVWHNDNTRFALSQEGFMELSVTDDGVYLQVFDIHHEAPVAGFWLDL